MKKGIAILLALAVLLTGAFAACKKEGEDNTGTSEQGIEDVNADFGFENVPVTDEKGKEVTDKDGNTVTTEVAVKYELDKKGRTVAKLIGKDGEIVTDKHGKEVTIDTDVEITTRPTTQAPKSTKKGQTTKTTESTTVPTKKDDQTTEPEITTKKTAEGVPLTSDSGERVVFNVDDQQIIKNMLEVPYLYVASYENSEGVPISCAAHAAMWMLQRDGISTEYFAAGTVVIDLFKYFGQTVVNFKSRVNSEGFADKLIYNEANDTFVVRSFEPKAQDVTIDHFEDLGYGNYYKVVGTVTDAGKYKNVIAIVQRNRLDNSLGFSIKALKWS
ncbi:MAG: hypothetical protein K6C14_02040 [Eubacterium sp.]|nr:hypothetical protein [Eubacterium sp.]